MLVSQSLWAVQFARPDATTNAGAWTAVNAATHHEALNEASASDADYIEATTNSTITLGLSDVTDPGTYANNHILRYRCQAAGSGGKERCNAALYDGGTLIFTTDNVNGERGAFTLHEFTIPDASGITEVKSSSRVGEDGRMHLSSEYKQNGEWVPGHEIIYVENPDAEVVFQ